MNKDKKDRILKAAESHFNKFGIKKTAVDEIAEAANVAKGTIYNNFKNKEGVIRELISEKIALLDKKIDNFTSNIHDPIEKIKAALLERMKFIKDTPFISDKQLLKDNQILSLIKNKLDKKSSMLIDKILTGTKSFEHLVKDKKQIIDTINFMLKGIEDSIKNKLNSISIEKIESDIDYILKLIFKSEEKNVSNNK